MKQRNKLGSSYNSPAWVGGADKVSPLVLRKALESVIRRQDAESRHSGKSEGNENRRARSNRHRENNQRLLKGRGRRLVSVRTKRGNEGPSKGVLSLERGVLEKSPFLHVVIPNCIDENLAASLLEWFETKAVWQHRAINDFYQLLFLDFRDVRLPENLRILVDDLSLKDLRMRAARLLGARLGSKVNVTARKMLPGYHVKVHTDYGERHQTHQIVVHLNRGWEARNGGLLLMLAHEVPTPDLKNLRCYAPCHRRAIFFEISPDSFHAVSKIIAGERYTLCFTFSGDP